MRKLIAALALCLASITGLAQTHNFPAKDTNNVFTGTNQFTKGAVLGPTTVAGLAFITPSDGMTVVVWDSLAGTCASGGGTTRILCVYNANSATWLSGSGLNCATTGIAYSSGCDPNTSLDGAGNLVAKSLTANGSGQSFNWGIDNLSFSPPAGEWALESTLGVVHLFDVNGVDYGRVLGTNACGAVTTGAVVGVLCLNGSGLALTSQLGTGTQNSGTCLHGDSTWSACAGGGGATPSCSPIGSSDTLTAAGTFATTCNPTLTLNVGSLIEIRAHGVYTTTATASPLLALQVNAGGTTALCSNTSNINPGINKNTPPGMWELHCYIHIATTGAPGTAYTWGRETLYNPTGGAQIGPVEWLPGPFNYITNSAQTFSIQETATMVAGQSITLLSFFVRQY